MRHPATHYTEWRLRQAIVATKPIKLIDNYPEYNKMMFLGLNQVY
jgi:hypothetical protein